MVSSTDSLAAGTADAVIADLNTTSGSSSACDDNTTDDDVLLEDLILTDSSSEEEELEKMLMHAGRLAAEMRKSISSGLDYANNNNSCGTTTTAGDGGSPTAAVPNHPVTASATAAPPPPLNEDLFNTASIVSPSYSEQLSTTPAASSSSRPPPSFCEAETVRAFNPSNRNNNNNNDASNLTRTGATAGALPAVAPAAKTTVEDHKSITSSCSSAGQQQQEGIEAAVKTALEMERALQEYEGAAAAAVGTVGGGASPCSMYSGKSFAPLTPPSASPDTSTAVDIRQVEEKVKAYDSSTSTATKGGETTVATAVSTRSSSGGSSAGGGVKWEKVDTATEGDEDYVPIADYSVGTTKTSNLSSSKSASSNHQTTGATNNGSSMAFLRPKVNSESTWKWEKVVAVDERDADYVPLSDYSSPRTASSFESSSESDTIRLPSLDDGTTPTDGAAVVVAQQYHHFREQERPPSFRRRRNSALHRRRIAARRKLIRRLSAAGLLVLASFAYYCYHCHRSKNPNQIAAVLEEETVLPEDVPADDETLLNIRYDDQWYLWGHDDATCGAFEDICEYDAYSSLFDLDDCRDDNGGLELAVGEEVELSTVNASSLRETLCRHPLAWVFRPPCRHGFASFLHGMFE